MPASHLRQYISMSPQFRGPDERFRGQIQIAWTPGDEAYTLSVTVYQGEDDQELRSLVVAPPDSWESIRTEGHLALFDLLELIRRSCDPFDDLL